jgi:hypothetical protein
VYWTLPLPVPAVNHPEPLNTQLVFGVLFVDVATVLFVLSTTVTHWVSDVVVTLSVSAAPCLA